MTFWKRGLVILAVTVLLMLPLAARAQQESTSSPSQQESSTDQQNQTSKQVPVIQGQGLDSSSQGEGADTGEQDRKVPYQPPPSTNLDTGLSLRDVTSPLHWGHLSLLSFGTSYMYDTNFPFSKVSVPPVGAAVVQGLLVYSVSKRKTTLDLQYRPYLLASAGIEQTQLTGHSLSLHTSRNLSRQWTLDVSDTYNYVPDQGRLFQQSFVPNFATGQFTQQPFLATGLRYLTNSLSLSATRAVNSKDRITLGVQYSLQHLSNDNPTSAQSSQYVNNAQTVGASIGWEHTWREGREFGVTYTYSQAVFRVSLPRTQYHSLMFSYDQKIRRSVEMGLSFGPSVSVTNSAGSRPYKTLQGSFHVFKTFRSSGLAFSLDRSQTFTGLIGNGYNNRADVYYTQKLGRRWTWTSGGAYIEQGVTLGGSYFGQGVTQGGGFRGRVAQSQLSFLLTRAWSTYATYGYLEELGNARLFGARQLVMVGAQWSWNPESRGRRQ